MHRRFPWLGRRGALGALGVVLLLGTTLGLQGCFHGRWHHGYDPAALDKHVDEIQADVAEELKVTPAQKPAFDALVAEYRQVAHQYRDGWHDTAVEVKQDLERQPLDAATIGDALKRRIHQRPNDATLDKLVDDSVAFYNTLSPEQQQTVHDHVLRRLQRHLG
jgi:LTXXQ motif family protein